MSVASAIHASAAVLLVVAGVAKLARPADGFAGLVGFRARPFLVRIVGGGEVVAGAGALWLGGPVAASAVGLLYAAFALAVLRALRTGAESCGCFGPLDAPPSRVHVGGNLALAAVSFVAAGADVAPVQAIAQSINDSPAVGAALAAEIVLMAGLGLVAFTALPEALGARSARRGAGPLFRALSSGGGEARLGVVSSGGGEARLGVVSSGGGEARLGVVSSGGGEARLGVVSSAGGRGETVAGSGGRQ